MHNISAVFFDLDGTLIDPNTHLIPENNLEALRKLTTSSIPIFVATGRSYDMLTTIPNLLSIGFSGFVCSNGQRIFDKDGKEIKSHFFSSKQVDELVSFCKSESIAVMLVTPQYKIAPLGISNYTIQAHSFFHEPLPDVIKEYNKEDVFMALIYNDMSYDFSKVEQIKGLRALPNQSTYADVVLADISKASGIAMMCDLHNISKQNIMAFGDGGNDIDMIEAAAIGVAMENASDELKNKSDFITKAVDDDGIAYALRQYHLIEGEE